MDDPLIQAVRYKLGLSYSGDVQDVALRWKKFLQSPTYKIQAERICLHLANSLFGKAFRLRLDLLADHMATQADVDSLEALGVAFRKWVQEDELRRSSKVARLIGEAMAVTSPAPRPATTKPVARPPKIIHGSSHGKTSPAPSNSPRTTSTAGLTGPSPYAPQSSQAGPKSPPSTQPAPGNAPTTSRGNLTVSSHPNPVPGGNPPSAQQASESPRVPPTPPRVDPGAADAAFGESATSALPSGSPLPPVPAPAAVPNVVASQWKNLPLPTSEPDLHSEFDQRTARSSEGFQIVGARVRGKKHKHEGTNCDDWFHFATSGIWTVIAVSDGAGSKKFSRVGAKAASETAVRHLTEKLATHRIENRSAWSKDSFEESDLVYVKQSLEGALVAAWEATKAEAAARATTEGHAKVLGRELKVGDLSATILVAVHASVPVNGVQASIVFGCSVGDGMITVIDKEGKNRLLMTPDSGEHSGETRFLDEREISPEKMKQRIFPFLGSMRALMLMTDGVADDYFPNDPGMSLLYGDLVLNGIVPVDVSQAEMAAALAGTKMPTLEEIRGADFHAIVENQTDAGPQRLKICSLPSYAELLGLPPESVVARPELLAAGAAGESLSAAKEVDERLRVWLDSYHVRGSFDDRTLVILHR